MIQARHGALAPALLSLLLFSACDLISPEDPDDPAVSRAMERIAELEAKLSVMDSAGLARLMEIRSDVRAATDLVLFPGDAGPLPDGYAGLVVARDPSTHELVLLEGAEDALPDGVRVRTYLRHDGGDLVVPLAPSGSFDFTEVAGTDPYLALTASDGEETLFALEDRSDVGSLLSLEGQLRDAAFVLAAGTSGMEAQELALQIEISAPSSGWSVYAQLQYFESSPGGDVSGFLEVQSVLDSPEGQMESYFNAALFGTMTDLQTEGFAWVGGGGQDDAGWFHEYGISGSLGNLQFESTGGEPAAPAGLPEAIMSLTDAVFEPVAGVLAGYEIPAALP